MLQDWRPFVSVRISDFPIYELSAELLFGCGPTHFFGKVCTSSLEKLTNVSFECFEARTKVESVQVLGGVNVQSTFPEYSSGPCCPKAGDVGVWYDVALVFVKY